MEKKKKAFCGNNFPEFSYVNMELILNLLRNKINPYRNEQGQCSRKHLWKIKNNLGLGHSLLIFRHSYTSVSPEDIILKPQRLPRIPKSKDAQVP